MSSSGGSRLDRAIDKHLTSSLDARGFSLKSAPRGPDTGWFVWDRQLPHNLSVAIEVISSGVGRGSAIQLDGIIHLVSEPVVAKFQSMPIEFAHSIPIKRFSIDSAIHLWTPEEKRKRFIVAQIVDAESVCNEFSETFATLAIKWASERDSNAKLLRVAKHRERVDRFWLNISPTTVRGVALHLATIGEYKLTRKLMRWYLRKPIGFNTGIDSPERAREFDEWLIFEFPDYAKG
ncbi:hypothetical protein ACWF99_20905 [Nocardia sp. NPDC055002]|uniref:hypothetical protein n=1 Tax=Nocardia sp. NPDC058114 TaxID=3346346 RepID=UPI0036DEB847